ncbi:hypothetical protein V1514DRAFT_279850 [Lipomyces japonicus]|uniref:uncharacterized protein n=1 Tax=Lipomyces japonicus TaxID=56871 RepID=UPI0034CEC39F
MSYNNIGLSTPRGSGTSGFVTTNAASVRPRSQRDSKSSNSSKPSLDHEQQQRRHPAREIADHDARRQVEVECLQLQDQLEDQG